MGKKDTSVDTELIGLSSDSIQNIRYLSLSIYTECLSWSITQPSPFFRDHRQYTPRRSQSQSNITPLRTVTSEALRAYHQTTSSDNNSERSTSTASQSQCGHNDSKKYHSGRHNANNSISYISSGSSEHQIALALALANTEGYLAQVRMIISIRIQLESMCGLMINRLVEIWQKWSYQVQSLSMVTGQMSSYKNRTRQKSMDI